MSFFMNKVVGALLGTILFGFFVIEVSHHLYPNPHGHHGEHMAMGYPVPGADENAHNGGDTTTETPSVDLPALLASADVAAGEAQFRACSTCHNDTAGAGAKVGPDLWGVVGRPVAHEAGFNYSRALQDHGGTWTFEELFHFIENPRGYIPGTAMTFQGLRRANARADLIAYLNTRSDNPLPLPAPTAAEPAGNEATSEAAAEASDASGDANGMATEATGDAGTAEEGSPTDEGGH